MAKLNESLCVECRKQRGFERSGNHIAAFTSERTKVDIRKHQTMEMCESLNQKIKIQWHSKDESKKNIEKGDHLLKCQIFKEWKIFGKND